VISSWERINLRKNQKPARRIIALCGKGGAGKTAVAAMMAGAVIRADPSARMLLIDADPAGGLGQAVGVEARKTVGEVRESVIAQARKKDTALKKKIANEIDYYIMEALEERPGFSLLAMGRGEAVGCFCPVNTLLREAVEELAGNYGRIIIDGEAGIEQIMRQVMKSVDTLLVISDLSARGLNTAALIKNLVRNKGVLSSPETLLVVNRVVDVASAKRMLKARGFTAAALIPEDPLVRERDAASLPLMEMPPDAPSMKAAAALSKRLFFARARGL